MSAILFGSIGTVADTCELQRRAFNEAFDHHGLDWHWDRDDYAAMLAKSGGNDRVADFALLRGEDVDAAAVHATKSERFQKLLTDDGVVPRAGVVDTIWEARNAGFKIALVTTTSPEGVSALLASLRMFADLPDFDVVVDSSHVEVPEPDRAAYVLALRKLNKRSHTCIAIEDDVVGVQAATAAGITCVAFPKRNTAQNAFAQAARRVDRLDFAELRAHDARSA